MQCQNGAEATMPEAQATKTPGRPWHLWLVGIIGGLLKNRLAFPVLLASAIGAIVSNLGGLLGSPPSLSSSARSWEPQFRVESGASGTSS